jgi:peptidyl-prolyl cis-trans isomerase B (cyclophilin B)
LPGNKRERELARAKYERQQAKRREDAARRRQRYQIIAAVVVAVLVVGGFTTLAFVLKGNKSTSATASTSPTPVSSASTAPSTSASPSPTATAVVPIDGTPALCAYRPGGTAARPVSLPSTSGATKPATRTVKISLNGKVVTISLLASKAPCTVNSFIHLASAKFFDNTPCHRLTTGSLAVLQCGDPTGTGSSGPGYQFNDENLLGATYPAGTVAMANAGPNTNGSQFFLVYADSTLDASYTPFGTVVGGLDVLKAIGAAGVKGGGSDGAPANPVTINSVVVGG